MDELSITLTKKREFKFKPFGKFLFKWIFKENKNLGTLPIHEVSFDSRLGFDYTEEQHKEVTDLMKKHKTDILIDESDCFYSIMGDYIVEVKHPKLTKYKQYLTSRGYNDSKESWTLCKCGF